MQTLTFTNTGGLAVKLLTDKDFGSGLLFALAGIMGLVLTSSFEFGSTAEPGPGFFPIILSTLLILIGIAVALGVLLREADPISAVAIRPFLLITCAVIVFAVCIERFGLVPSVFVTAIVASFARANYGWVHRILAATGLAFFSALLFIGALKLPVALWSF